VRAVKKGAPKSFAHGGRNGTVRVAEGATAFYHSGQPFRQLEWDCEFEEADDAFSPGNALQRKIASGDLAGHRLGMVDV
jgi:hypothetical protein